MLSPTVLQSIGFSWYNGNALPWKNSSSIFNSAREVDFDHSFLYNNLQSEGPHSTPADSVRDYQESLEEVKN